MTTQAPSAGTRIVVGVDGSKPSKLALSWAVRISATTGASIDAVTAWHFPVNFGWSYVPDAWDPIADATKCLTNSVDGIFGAERPTGLSLRLNLGRLVLGLFHGQFGGLGCHLAHLGDDGA